MIAPDQDWTPAKGIRRGLAFGSATAILLGAVLFPLAWYVPLLVLNFYLRAFLGLVVAWTIFGIVQRTSSMVGFRVSAVSIGFASLVLLSNHVAFAIAGVQTRAGVLAGWAWFSLPVIAWSNLSGALGIGLAAWIRHDGGADFFDLVDIFRSRLNP